MLLIGTLLAITVLSAVVFLWAWRGKRINDHPICRRCGFDLVGNAKADTCPECGATLTRKSAIRRGERRQRKRWLAVAIAVLLLSISGGALKLWSTLGNAAAQRWLPVAVLRWEAHRDGTQMVAAALHELDRRLNAGQLSKQQTAVVADDALAAQANRKRPWDSAWASFIEDAHDQGVLTKARWRAYGKNLLSRPLKLLVRARVQQGNPLEVAVKYGPARMAGTNSAPFTGLYVESWSIDGKTYHLNPLDQQPSTNRGPKPGVGRALPLKLLSSHVVPWNRLKPNQPLRRRVKLALGKHRLAVRFHVMAGHPGFEPPGDIVASTYKVLHARFTVVGSNKPTAVPITDASRGAHVRKSVAVKASSVDYDADTDPEHSFDWGGTLVSNRPPVPIAAEVHVRDADGRTCDAGSVSFPAKRQTSHMFFVTLPKKFAARQVTIVLTPSEEAAEHSVGIARYWGKPILLKHVKVDWSQVPKAQRPASVMASKSVGPATRP